MSDPWFISADSFSFWGNSLCMQLHWEEKQIYDMYQGSYFSLFGEKDARPRKSQGKR